MNTSRRTNKLVVIAVLTALLIIMSVTPLGYLNIGPLAITFNMIPVAIGAILLGPSGGAALGAVFGLTSFAQCLGILGSSPFGALLLSVNPLYTAILCIVPRTLTGFLIGLVNRQITRRTKLRTVSYSLTGFLAAALNTVFFMTVLVLLFQPTLVDNGLMKEGQNVILFMIAFVGINAVFEAVAATFLTGGIGLALYKSRLGAELN